MIIHKIVPKKLRAYAITMPFVRKLFKKALAGRVLKKNWINYIFHFDGYRNFGFWTVDLDGIEKRQRFLAKKIIQCIEKPIIYDVGANIGFWTLYLHEIMPHRSNLVAFEPDPENIKYLMMNLERNGLNDVAVNEVALSDRIGNAILHCDETGAMNSLADLSFSSSQHSCPELCIKTLSLDQAAEIHGIPDFVKLDVEGHEYEVLLGSLNVLSKGKTVWLIEVTRNGDAILQFMNDNDYVVTNLDGEPLQHPEYYVAAYPKNRIK